MLRKCSEIFTSLKTLNSLHILQIVKCTARDTTHKYYIITLYMLVPHTVQRLVFIS